VAAIAVSTPARASTTRFAKAALTQSVKAAAAGIDAARARRSPPAPGITVLAYHQVGGPRPSSVNLSVEAFDAQMAWLAEHADVVTLDVALAALLRPEPLAAPQVVVTFDDGTPDLVEHALPILERHAIPATLYVATQWIDEQRSFWDDGTVLSWAGLAELRDSGLVSIASHGHAHLLLDRASAAAVADDLDRSIDLLGEHLGVQALDVAYPKALTPSPDTVGEVRKRFRSGALAGTRPNRPVVDPFALFRSPIQRADGLRWFRRKAAGGMQAEDVARRALNKARYRGLDR